MSSFLFSSLTLRRFKSEFEKKFTTQIRGYKTFCKTLRIPDAGRAMLSAFLAAKVLGVTSAKIKIIIVKITEPIKTPLFPNNSRHKIVVKAAANIFTKLFPIKITPSSLSGRFNNLSALLAERLFCLIKCFNLYLLSAIMPVSALEKNADNTSKIEILERSNQTGISFKLDKYCSNQLTV